MILIKLLIQAFELASCMYVYRGMSKMQLKKYDSAIKDFDAALHLELKLEIAYYNRGKSKCQLNDFKGDLNDYNEVLNFNPRDTIVYKLIAWTNNHIENWTEAIKAYSELILIDSNNASALDSRGWINAS